MTMFFEDCAAALKTILGDAQGSDFVTVGYQARRLDADEVIDSSRLVQVIYDSGIFPRSSSTRSEAQNHQMTFPIVLTVSKASSGDLATLNDANATAGELTTALAGVQLAEDLANDSWNALARLVYQILMDLDNAELGLDPPAANTWIDTIQKDKPNAIGDLVVLRGVVTFTCQGKEEITGVTPVTGEGVDVTIEMTGTPEDEVQQTKVSVTTP